MAAVVAKAIETISTACSPERETQGYGRDPASRSPERNTDGAEADGAEQGAGAPESAHGRQRPPAAAGIKASATRSASRPPARRSLRRTCRSAPEPYRATGGSSSCEISLSCSSALIASLASRRTCRTAVLPCSAATPTCFASSSRRSVVSSGIGRRIRVPSLFGFRPRSDCRIARSMAWMAFLS